MKLTRFIILCAAGLAWTPSAPAQNTNGDTGNHSTNGSRPAALGRPGDGLGPVFGVLTDEQRASVAQVLRDRQDQVRALETRILDARRELMAAALGGNFDRERVRQRAQTVADLEAELSLLRLEALARVQPPLTPEQLHRITNSVPIRPPPVSRPPPATGRRRILSNPNRDQNDLPPKQP